MGESLFWVRMRVWLVVRSMAREVLVESKYTSRVCYIEESGVLQHSQMTTARWRYEISATIAAFQLNLITFLA